MHASQHARVGRLLLAACVSIAAVSLVTVLIALPAGAPMSADPGAPTVPWWVVLLPAAVGIVLALLLPPSPRRQTALVVSTPRFHASTWLLLALAGAFPLIVSVLGIAGGEDYVVAKLLLLIVVPAIVVGVLRGVRIVRVPGAWRWWAPALVITVWVLLSQIAPWNPEHDLSGIDPLVLAISAAATAITAGLGEELFYRRWLQTRLEAGLGPWPGIAVASLAFALMHLGSHGSGAIAVDIARVVVSQGSFGLLMGVLWWRYRNFAAIVTAHLIVNGWPVLVHVVHG
ncbi:hypothetical protein GCM10009847_06020 [Leucobacter tardus]|uniref:CPBP family intramembrane metalloprotease n=1 Tax=Leucobacter tardus TaxID=501483 RepID=A0A939QAS7_9MICO|nr:type II CAAX endopeptidase family protein [Leucobacter tardus]MBO2988805.1 CPBP family intramembrane metalloprotease [Leucobacter tardus]